MNFTTKGIEEKVFESKYITPGINEVTIAGITSNESGTPYVEFNFVSMKNNNQTASIKFYLSDAASKRSLEKIKHIATKVVSESDIDNVQATSITDYSTKLSNLLVGKSLRIKFSGETVAGKEGKGNWIKATIGLPTFAESLTVNPTKLKFDPNNQYDMKPLPAVTNVSSSTVTSDLPF